ncbi:MAG: hypothetical protein JNN15_07320 [Blastocatellia bacterium]|nr:hypothetical protein [Blastocatellia bacterium]
MENNYRLPSIWIVWLSVASLGVSFFGLFLVLAPTLSTNSFSLLVYAEPDRISRFGTEAVNYIQLTHAVMGAVMFGWGVMMLLIVRTLFLRGLPEVWSILVVSLISWFVPDTTFSLWSGFWQNAVLNLLFMALFFVPLAATRPFFKPALK